MASQQTYPASSASDYMHTLLCDPSNVNICNDTQESEWVFPNLAWPIPFSPCAESPLSSLSSPDIHQDSSWNPFEQSFSSMQDNENVSFASSEQNASLTQPTWREPSHYAPGDPRGDGKSYVSLSAINERPRGDHGAGDGDDDTPRAREYSMNLTASSPDRHGPVRLPAWGSSRRNSAASNSSKSTTGKRHKRRKSSSSTVAPDQPLTQGGHRLRSTSSATSASVSSSYTSTSKKSQPARTNHNQVEKQYRNRLNGQFETLLETLPHDPDMGGDKRVSKAEVLILAKKHIQKLEMERRELEEVNVELEGRVEGLIRRWADLGGMVLP